MTPAAADRRPVLFLHIPKTAGTSLVLMLQNLFGDGRTVRWAYEDADLRQKIAAAAGDGPACITGHLPLYLFNDRLRHFRPFTVLRHPVARVFSLYRFLRRHQDLEKMGLQRDFSFEQFLDARNPNIYAQLNNGMCRVLSGDPRFIDPNDAAFRDPDRLPEAITGALRALAEMEVGLVEDMANTLAMLRGAWGVPFQLAEPTVNTTAADGMESDWHNVHRIIARNTFDLALYQQATALFAARLRTARTATPSPVGGLVFAPALHHTTPLRDIPGRQGFHDWEAGSFAWLADGAPARLHFHPPAGATRIMLRVFGVTPDYPFDAVRFELNGVRALARAHEPAARWATLEVQADTMADGLNTLTITPPYAVPMRLLHSQSNDRRAVSIGVGSVTFIG